ncbi:Protein neprosin [Cardamine amara subsp. amara]|uniref:Protein neprosin n=1 Tax=Cardamine amara subsp. amara TaxID=228776 RepID=A0ABD1AS04_CARAN
MELGYPVMCMILLCSMLCCSLMMSHCHGIVEPAETLKSFEDFAIEQKLKIINKPAVKIIKSIYGERYGCVDFYKQPGFDHPSMKNHTFHYKMRLMSYSEGSKMKKELLNKKTFGHLWKNGVGCPTGTVPILRITKNDLLRLKSFGGDHSNPRSSWSNTYKLESSSNQTHHFAVVRTKGKPRIYNGASMNVRVLTPSVAAANQFSSARLHFQIGNDYIQAGWTVYPQLYPGPAGTRLFVCTNAGGRSCYNNLCPDGIIMVRKDLIFDRVLTEMNVTIAILKDKNDGNWWLLLGPSEIKVGFWPANRFKESSGTKVEWGGEVYSSSLPSPPMGNGHFPVGNPKMDSYIRLISTVDANYKTDDVVKNTETFSDNNDCYKVRDTTESFWEPAGHILVYGGPGCK